MKLSDLAKKVAELPETDFEYPGAEQYHPELAQRCLSGLPQETIDFILNLKERIQEQTLAILDLQNAYNQLKEIILDAEVESFDSSKTDMQERIDNTFEIKIYESFEKGRWAVELWDYRYPPGYRLVSMTGGCKSPIEALDKLDKTWLRGGKFYDLSH